MTTAATVPTNEDYGWLVCLASWLSPSYPVGAYCYSHGIEWAAAAGAVATGSDLTDYIATVLETGGGWTDLVLAAAAWRAAEGGRREELDRVAEMGLALRPTRELALESLQQGSAFAATTRAAWPGTALDWLAMRQPGAIVYPIAVGAACAGRVPLRPMLVALGHAAACNLVSAGVRLVPLGQTDGQRTMAALAPLITSVARRAAAASLDDLGSAAPQIELYSMYHEAQYTRLFRS
ncbi:MAG TPA: urease accessory UreF family protein [Methylocella sp.]|nr:urease accessory UreF family protein [Methylocella sp.]